MIKEHLGIDGQPINNIDFKCNESLTKKVFAAMAEKAKFKINDLVEVPMWEGDQRKNWIIVDFASDDSEAIIRNIFSKTQSIVLLSKLKHQKKKYELGL